MRNVEVDRDGFIARVSENRENHRGVFEEALDGFRDQLMAELEERVHDLRRGRVIDQYIGLPVPEDHTDDYDRILTMAEMSIDDTITLTEDEFAMYVMDQWRWKDAFNDSTLLYTR
jgi:hypothetical protein